MWAQWLKNLPAKAGDAEDIGLILGSGRSPRGGNDSPLQYSCLENPMDRGTQRAIVHGVTNSQTRLSDETTGPKDLGSSRPSAAHHCSRLYRVRL